MVEQHVILAGLTEYGYMGIDDGTKIRLFLDGITAPELEVVKTRILSDAGLRKDLEGCTILFKDFTCRPTPSYSYHCRTKRKSDDTSSDNEDRYYRTKEHMSWLWPKRRNWIQSVRTMDTSLVQSHPKRRLTSRMTWPELWCSDSTNLCSCFFCWYSHKEDCWEWGTFRLWWGHSEYKAICKRQDWL